MIGYGRVVAVDGGWCVEERSQQIFLDVANVGGILVQAFDDILDVRAIQPKQLVLDERCRIFVTGDNDVGLSGTECLDDKVYNLVQAVLTKARDDVVVFDILPDSISQGNGIIVSVPIPSFFFRVQD